eukprot:3070051-Pyramimonas_sp.AAC.1
MHVCGEPEEFHRHRISDHVPIVLTFSSCQPSKRDRPIPRGICKGPLFAKVVTDYENLCGIQSILSP